MQNSITKNELKETFKRKMMSKNHWQNQLLSLDRTSKPYCPCLWVDSDIIKRKCWMKPVFLTSFTSNLYDKTINFSQCVLFIRYWLCSMQIGFVVQFHWVSRVLVCRCVSFTIWKCDLYIFWANDCLSERTHFFCKLQCHHYFCQ